MKNMEKTTVYMGSFNPLHIGHVAVIDRMLESNDRIHLFVRYNDGVDLTDEKTKKGWFDTLNAQRGGRILTHFFHTDQMKGKTYDGNIFAHFLNFFMETLGTNIDEVWCGHDAVPLIESCAAQFPNTDFVIIRREEIGEYNSTAIRNDLEGHRDWVPDYVYATLAPAGNGEPADA